MKSTFFLTLIIGLLLQGYVVSFAQNNKKTDPVAKNLYTHLNIQVPTKNSSEYLQKYLETRFITQPNAFLRLSTDINTPFARHITYQVMYDSLEILGKQIKVVLDKNNRALSALVNAPPLQFANQNNYSYSLDLAKKQVTDLLGGEILEAKKAIFINNFAYYVYQIITINDTVSGSHAVIIDPQTGEWVQKENRALGFDIDTTGRGYVFFPDPLTRLGEYYDKNTPYSDHHDSTNSFLNDARVPVVLNNLKFDSTFVLSGKYVTIKNLAGEPNTAPRSSDGNFYYDRSQDEFEAVNVYYHIDSLQTYIQSLGFENMRNGNIDIDPRGQVQDNSKFIPAGSSSYILFGTGGVDDAEDADVIVHEYGHALSEAASPNSMCEGGVCRERQGIDEGFGDYLAAAASLDRTAFRWQDIFTWDGHNEYWIGRTVEDTRNYSTITSNSGNIYDYGALWATALVRIRQNAIKAIVDKIVLQEMYMNAQQMTLNDAALLLLEADTLVTGGEYSTKIIESFCQSGIFTDSLCALYSFRQNIYNKSNIAVFPNPSTGKITVDILPGAFLAQPENIQVISMEGKQIYTTPIYNQRTKIDLFDQPEGLYFIRINDNNGNVLKAIRFALIK